MVTRVNSVAQQRSAATNTQAQINGSQEAASTTNAELSFEDFSRFLNLIFSLQSFTGMARGVMHNPLALMGNLALMAPWLSSIIGQDGRAAHTSQPLKQPPAPKTISERVQDANAAIALADQELQDGAKTLGYSVSKNEASSKVTRDSKSKRRESFSAAIKDINVEIKAAQQAGDNEAVSRLKVAKAIYRKTYETKGSITDAEERRYAVNTKLDELADAIALSERTPGEAPKRSIWS